MHAMALACAVLFLCELGDRPELTINCSSFRTALPVVHPYYAPIVRYNGKDYSSCTFSTFTPSASRFNTSKTTAHSNTVVVHNKIRSRLITGTNTQRK